MLGRLWQKYLKWVQYCKVEVIAEDANAAAYKYYKEYQDLCNSSVADMLRDATRSQHGMPSADGFVSVFPGF